MDDKTPIRLHVNGARSTIDGRRRASCCPTPCARTAASPARTWAASTACAAPARCWSTAGRRASCLTFAVQMHGHEITTIEVGGARRSAVAAAAGAARGARPAMRLLHAGHRDDLRDLPARPPATRRTSRSARRCRATCAAAPAITTSSRRSARPRGACARGRGRACRSLNSVYIGRAAAAQGGLAPADRARALHRRHRNPRCAARLLRALAACPCAHRCPSTPTAARGMPGVVAVVTGPRPRALDHAPPDGAADRGPASRSRWTRLPIDRVRFQGDPVACVVATDRYVAEDAAEQVVVDYEVLPAGHRHAAGTRPARAAGRRDAAVQSGVAPAASSMATSPAPHAPGAPRRRERASRSTGRRTCRSRRAAASRCGTRGAST